jgi:pimeloyl-ACP methyl ester carboxylesterase
VRTIFYLGGDSYPGEQDWENAFSGLLTGNDVRFVHHPEFHLPWTVNNLPSIEDRLGMIAEAIGRAGANDEIFLIGRSSGARIATLFAAQNPRVLAVVCLFYPFRAPGMRIEPERFTHLATIETLSACKKPKD